MRCTKCGKETVNGAAFCHHCGAPQAKANSVQNMNRGNKASYNNMCVIGLGVAFLAFAFDFGQLGGLIGFGLSLYGFMECKKKIEGGKLLAIAGIVLGFMAIMNASWGW